MTLEEAMKMICDHRAKVKRTKDDWHDGYYDGLTAALMMLSEDKPADTDKPIWEAKDKMTLKELARELRKLFEFDILTYSAWEDGDCYVTEQLDEIILWWRRVPDALPEYDDTAGNFYGDAEVLALLKISSMSAMISESLDLSEYADENGNIDYSKCIVEVE